jgi:hypothetical protein
MTQQPHVSPYGSQVSFDIAAEMAVIEERPNTGDDDARVAQEECHQENERCFHQG